ncbi:VanZ family protein [Saonia flava]|uniref:VanZ family protein n=1 Tax=Saonia flava TaxID=523696 RepID=A0A846R2A0_9FLAO|nr:VanZ family protein [Saonia flava]NJB70949.1 VanZ family protein [Saonia flava]
MPKKPFFTIAFIGWLLFVTYLSLTSFKGIDIDESWIDIPHMDKLVHCAFYLGVSVLGSLFLREITKGKMVMGKAILWATIFAIAYGMLIEVLQVKFTQNRQGDIADALANGLGAFMGAGLIKFMFSKKMPLKWRN